MRRIGYFVTGRAVGTKHPLTYTRPVTLLWYTRLTFARCILFLWHFSLTHACVAPLWSMPVKGVKNPWAPLFPISSRADKTRSRMSTRHCPSLMPFTYKKCSTFYCCPDNRADDQGIEVQPRRVHPFEGSSQSPQTLKDGGFRNTYHPMRQLRIVIAALPIT